MDTRTCPQAQFSSVSRMTGDRPIPVCRPGASFSESRPQHAHMPSPSPHTPRSTPCRVPPRGVTPSSTKVWGGTGLYQEAFLTKQLDDLRTFISKCPERTEQHEPIQKSVRDPHTHKQRRALTAALLSSHNLQTGLQGSQGRNARVLLRAQSVNTQGPCVQKPADGKAAE